MKSDIYLKAVIKGSLLGLTVVIVHLLCTMLFGSYYFPTVVIFAALMTYFLKSENVACILITGFIGLFFMFFIEISTIILQINPVSWFTAPEDTAFVSVTAWMLTYINAFWGSMLGLAAAVILTVKKVRFPEIPVNPDELKQIFKKGEIIMEKSAKFKLLLFTAISAVTFSYLILPEQAGISIPIFFIIQTVLLFFIIKDKKRLLLFIPAVILSLNYFISGSPIWRISNFFIILLIYGILFINFSFKDTSFAFIKNILSNIIEPITTLHIPFKWAAEISNDKNQLMKRIGIALLITVPCMIILILLLSNADMIFSHSVETLAEKFFEFISVNAIVKIITGLLAGLYLFGIVYPSFREKSKKEGCEKKPVSGDLVIINIFLSFVLILYTIFVIIQFKYLFAGTDSLPYGLSYTEYARKGFFELLALTGINILIILIIVRLTISTAGRWKNCSKFMCCYLCAVTLILLASSFYRMWLYSDDDGLTRLRFMVFGFLIFESIGLLITFKYIISPKFNICAVYLSIALFYYMLLNIIPMDYFIAQNQINKYLRGEREDLAYVFTLSSDAATPISRLNDENTKDMKRDYFARIELENKLYPRWQRYNISADKALNLNIK